MTPPTTCPLCGGEMQSSFSARYYCAQCRLTAPLEALEKVRAMRSALVKIDAIRDDIIGRQSVNWSSHIYPLVAALGDAGFEGAGYEVARARAFAANDAIAALEARIAELQRNASEVPGLTATLDEYAHFAELVRECLAEHDAAKALFTWPSERTDAPRTQRIREALAALPDVKAGLAELQKAATDVSALSAHELATLGRLVRNAGSVEALRALVEGGSRCE